MMPNIQKPYISIVICTYNRADLLLATLDSLQGLSGIDKAEVIIVDNNSNDHTRSVAQAYIRRNTSVKARYFFEPSQGLSTARNTGIQAAEGTIIAFLDDDAIPCPEWISTIAASFDSRQDVYAMGGIIRPNFESSRPDWLIKSFELPYTIVDMGSRVMEYPARLHPCGANMAIRRSFFENHSFPTNLGRKGNSLLSGEEQWIFDRMRKEGKSILYHPEMAVVHFIPASRLTRQWIQQRYYYQGVSNACIGNGIGGKVSLLGMLAGKMLYVIIASLFARSEGSRLLVKCRLESILGSLDMLRRRGNMPLAR
ncbi:glycosyltransferase [Paenibacillus radicis (ex Xue et al. 2023)]|uniref:Glycosyltransferase n=1 Tax=Paenibacillus radicis (ex Xue et al. 2023) TaxID=2972489 RepID=A0ABT1YT87_9BACL|nr:glycosyltransferase [Paenibacillus radicis (ex Xue et al. 2023)]MCR8635915.1 glycosyltransferase [Paenibacillus radicis (ex Xue et al. 2023)]